MPTRERTTRMPITVISAGLIGRAHVAHALVSGDVVPIGVAHASEAGRDFAASVNLP